MPITSTTQPKAESNLAYPKIMSKTLPCGHKIIAMFNLKRRGVIIYSEHPRRFPVADKLWFNTDPIGWEDHNEPVTIQNKVG